MFDVLEIEKDPEVESLSEDPVVPTSSAEYLTSPVKSILKEKSSKQPSKKFKFCLVQIIEEIEHQQVQMTKKEY